MTVEQHRRHVVEQARKTLADLEQLDLRDDRAMARMLGRLEVAVKQLLDLIDDAELPTT